MRKKDAYEQIKPQRKSLKEKVLEAIHDNKGLTTYELVNKLSLKIHSLSARLAELEQDGLIFQSDRIIGEKTFTFWNVTPYDLIEAYKVNDWNKRGLIWLQKGLNNGFITKKELDLLKKQSKLF